MQFEKPLLAAQRLITAGLDLSALLFLLPCCYNVDVYVLNAASTC